MEEKTLEFLSASSRLSSIAQTIQDRFNLIRDQLASYKLPQEIEEIEYYLVEITKIKKEKNAVILGHNYMSPEVYILSDFDGDSFTLSRHAADTNADIILFNGVYFMAETAKILNPQKKVLIADKKAGCSLAESIQKTNIIALRKKYPGVPVVSYINCSAEVKAESDIICTSANAVKIVNSCDSEEVILIPDQYLANNVQKETKKKIISWQGKCMVHELFTQEDVELTKRMHDNVQIIAHPECKPEVTDIVDFTGSTSQIKKHIKNSSAKKVMLLTECSMGENLKIDFPKIEFVANCQNCPHMKKITLKKILDCLINEQDEVDVPGDVILKANKALNRMLEIGR